MLTFHGSKHIAVHDFSQEANENNFSLFIETRRIDEHVLYVYIVGDKKISAFPIEFHEKNVWKADLYLHTTVIREIII